VNGWVGPKMICWSLSLDQDMLDRLEAVYIESRYPGEMGLLPYGKPTEKEAKQFYDFAQHFYEQVQTVLAVCRKSEAFQTKIISV
jgi:hypothetical protein